ncbi:MAG TPA: EAL domain-containing protein, partial [Geothrix sp.]|nr:EAL domain-containing protein [Geothrix sp.]
SIWSIVEDITAHKRIETDLRIAATAFESREAMIVTDALETILRVNQAFTEITGYSAEEAVGQTPRLLKSGRHNQEFYREMWECIHRTGGWQGEVWDRRKNGEEYPKWLTISAVKGEDGAVTHYIGTHFDITERKKAEVKIQELAFYDQLTGLPNRTLLLDRLKQAMSATARDEGHGALLFIDLDHFKTLNDTMGHDMGDLLLKQVARRLTENVREGDTVARLGGDEFVVVLPGLSSNLGEAALATEMIGEKILATLNVSYQLGGLNHTSTASLGATLFMGKDTTVDDLMKQADLAMYRSKESGRNALRFFDPDMARAAMNRASLEKDLREAIEQEQFVLHYQAQVQENGEITGAEVLLRWQHPQRGLVPPAEFIHLAEETGLILPLGQWVIEAACARLARWGAEPDLAQLTLAVNVSPRQFRQAEFVNQLIEVIGRAGANPDQLKLELTESLLVENPEEAAAKMTTLRALGVGFALDDFGTGYSSLSYLKRLPFDLLKIDRSFVSEVLTDSNDAAIASTIVALAGSLGLGVIAEGVETAAQRNFLAGIGCHAYQGYLYSRPIPIELFEMLVRQGCAKAQGQDS